MTDLPTWVEKVQTVDAIETGVIKAMDDNPGWRLLGVGLGSDGQTTLTYGWPWPGETKLKGAEYFSPPVGRIALDGQHALIDSLVTRFEDGGWLSTLVWNTRNEFLAWPLSQMSANHMRMIVEAFLVEIAQVREDGGRVCGSKWFTVGKHLHWCDRGPHSAGPCVCPCGQVADDGVLSGHRRERA